MSNFVIKRILPKQGTVQVQVHIPSVDVTFFYGMSTSHFNRMSDEELEMKLEEVVNQKIKAIQTSVDQDRIARLKEKYK